MDYDTALTKLHEILRVLIGESAEEWTLQKQSTEFASDFEWASHLLSVHRECCHNDCCKLVNNSLPLDEVNSFDNEAIQNQPIKPICLYPSSKILSSSRYAIKSRRKNRLRLRGHPVSHVISNRTNSSSTQKNFVENDVLPTNNSRDLTDQAVSQTLENLGDIDDVEVIEIKDNPDTLGIKCKTEEVDDTDHYIEEIHYPIPEGEKSYAKPIQYNENWVYPSNYQQPSTSKDNSFVEQSYYEDNISESVEMDTGQHSSQAPIKIESIEDDEQKFTSRDGNTRLMAISQFPQFQSIVSCNPQSDDGYFISPDLEMSYQRVGNHFKCEVCGKIYLSMSSLRRHHQLHSIQKPYFCSLCQKRFTQSCSVIRHMRTQHVIPVDL